MIGMGATNGTDDQSGSAVPVDELATFGTGVGLRSVVLEVERHVSDEGWDQPGRLFALVPTAELVAAEPALAGELGIGDGPVEGLTPVEQEVEDEHAAALERLLPQIGWPESVSGAAVVLERVVLPPEVEQAMPAGPDEAAAFAAGHPSREEVRLVVGVLRSGEAHCVLRLRSHDSDDQLVQGADLVPGLVSALRQTLDERDPS